MPTECHRTRETSQSAHELHELGYHLVPCRPGGKVPLIRWKLAGCSADLIDGWFDRFGGELNIAICAGKSGVIVLDADTERAARWIAEHCPPTQMTASTPRGGLHAYFRAPDDVPPPSTNLFGIGLDVRSRMSLLLCSPSWSAEHDRRWVWNGPVLPPEELPVLPSRLIRREPFPKSENRQATLPKRSSGPIRDVTRWIMGVPSVQGAYGSNGCFKVACRLADAGFSRGEAMHWLRAWNARVPVPPWSEAELAHKLEDAFRR